MNSNDETLLARLEAQLQRLRSLCAEVERELPRAGAHARRSWAQMVPDLEAELSREHPLSPEAALRLEAEALRLELFLEQVRQEALGTQPPGRA